MAAWEAETTHTGLAEQAALGSRLHKRLVTLGFTGGLFEPLTINKTVLRNRIIMGSMHTRLDMEENAVA
jgi:hypothetical protein